MSKINSEKLVTLPYAVARDLLEEKIRWLNQEIEKILVKWNQTDVDTFQEVTRQGKIPEAETDAIIAGNLDEKLAEYRKLYREL